MDELVKRLNVFRLKEGEYQYIPVYVSEIIGEAADVIEELTRENKELSFRSAQLEAMNDALIGETGAADALMVVSQPRWIPVTERLPEAGVDVLVKFPQNMAVASIDIGEWVVNSGDGWCTDINLAGGEKNPTHWMPLPEPPKEDDT